MSKNSNLHLHSVLYVLIGLEVFEACLIVLEVHPFHDRYTLQIYLVR